MQPSEAAHFPLTGRNHQEVVSSTVLAVTEKEKPQPGLTPDWGFLVTLPLLPLEVREGFSGDRFP